MISVPGLGSGLDVSSIVSQLVAAEGDARTLSLARKQDNVNAEISAFGTLKSVLSQFQTQVAGIKASSSFELTTATSGDESVFTASSSGTAAAGKYQIEVIDVAEAQKLLSTGFTDSDTDIGTGTLTISVGSESFDVAIDSSNQTVAGIRDAINKAADNTGVSATLVNVDDGGGGTETKLIFTSNNPGTANEISITVDDDDATDKDNAGLSQLFYAAGDPSNQLTEINAAVDASIEIDGQAVTSSGNTISNAIDGVTINLLDAKAGTLIDLEIAIDTDSIVDKLDEFVASYNSLITAVNSLTRFDADTGSAGILLGDATVLGISSQLRRNLTNSVTGLTGSITNLVDLGITTGPSGLLEFDSTIVKTALDNNLTDVSDFFTSDDGIATRLDTLLDEFLKTDGTLDSKTSGLNDTLEDIGEDFEVLNRRLENLEQRLLSQFTALDTLIVQLQTTGDFLTQSLASAAAIINNRNN